MQKNETQSEEVVPPVVLIKTNAAEIRARRAARLAADAARLAALEKEKEENGEK